MRTRERQHASSTIQYRRRRIAGLKADVRVFMGHRMKKVVSVSSTWVTEDPFLQLDKSPLVFFPPTLFFPLTLSSTQPCCQKIKVRR